MRKVSPLGDGLVLGYDLAMTVLKSPSVMSSLNMTSVSGDSRGLLGISDMPCKMLSRAVVGILSSIFVAVCFK